MPRSRTVLIVAVPAAILLALLVGWRSCRRPEAAPRTERAKPTQPEETPSRAPRGALLKSGRPDVDRSQMLAWIRSLGRAVVMRDARTYGELKATAPSLYESDVPWLLGLLKEELFTAAGAAEFVSWFSIPDAVAELASMLRGAAHPAAKDVAVAALARLGGRAALLEALAGNPDSSIRARAAAALGGIEGLDVFRGLMDALRDPDVDVRRAAADSLRSMPSREMIEALLARLPGEPDPRVAADLALAVYAAGRKDILPRIYEALDRRPDVAAAIRERLKLDGETRFARTYDEAFFKNGGDPVPLRSGHRRIGIIVEPATSIAPLFASAPLDRYREFFYYRVESEYAEDLASGATPRAYEVDGRAIPGGLPRTDLDGRVHLRFRDPKEFAPGILGFTEGSESWVTSISLLHEFGHAFARLADEYDSPKASNAGEANVDQPGREPKWRALIDRGLLSAPRPRGDRVIPSDRCHMNNHATDDRWCPVCQLEIIARICEDSGATAPW